MSIDQILYTIDKIKQLTVTSKEVAIETSLRVFIKLNKL